MPRPTIPTPNGVVVYARPLCSSFFSMTPEVCPNCGALVPQKARACPECGADDATCWSETSHAQRLGLPDDNFDYVEYVKEECGERRESRVRPRGISWVWWVVAV